MTEIRVIHIIRHKNGAIDATARGVTELAALSWRDSGAEIFAFEIELPVQVAADFVSPARQVTGGAE
jgi:hypothetical protein